jgi:sugar-specific transcriptional regulator TrmB
MNKGRNSLNQELLTKMLTRLGLKEIDAKIYILLSKEGPQKGRNIAGALSLYKEQLNRSLERLQKKGAVNASFEYPARFSAVDLEKVLDFWIEAKKEQALALQKSKEKLLSTWKDIVKKDFADS